MINFSFTEKNLYKKAENGTDYLDPQVLNNLKNLTEQHGFNDDWVENDDNFIKCDSWIYDDTFGVTGLTENDWACPGSASQNLQVVFSTKNCIKNEAFRSLSWLVFFGDLLFSAGLLTRMAENRRSLRVFLFVSLLWL